MATAQESLIQVFKECMKAVLVEHAPEKALAVMVEDVIGIGMGEQGIVCCKADAARIVGDGKADPNTTTELEYVHLQARCYEERFGTVCGVLKIKITDHEKVVVSTLGQIMTLHKQQSQWRIVSLQATPLFEQIEELEAYPIKFAENVLETYRQQEQLAQNAQNDSVAVYLVNFTQGIFESAVLKSDLLIQTQKGDPYEEVMFDAARQFLGEEQCHQFIRTFSLGNVLKTYQNGQTELWMEYEMLLPGRKSIWMKSLVKLYIDKADEALKGYLYVIDIDAVKTRELELQSRAELDPLTGLYNKNAAELKISELLSAFLPNEQAAFFMIDLDYFKRTNDTYGHLEGDRILRETANCIRALIRSGDLAGRLGGDEFCIYLQGELSQAALAQKAQSLCESVRQLRPAGVGGVSCSIGIALCGGPAPRFEELYHQADLALYQQKNSGRGGYTLYGSPAS